jgi:hypothetical protein
LAFAELLEALFIMLHEIVEAFGPSQLIIIIFLQVAFIAVNAEDIEFHEENVHDAGNNS